MQGALVVLEGAEGVGKTTQARRLVDTLTQHGVSCDYFREPGGTLLGESIRAVLLERSQSVTPAAEALLFMASRAQLMSEKVTPALREGRVVILDRFFLSTYAYQVHGRGLPEAEVREANLLAVGSVVPDATVVLRLPASEGLERAAARSARDYMEQLGDDFHASVARAFDEFVKPAWQSTHTECGPVERYSSTHEVDPGNGILTVHAEIITDDEARIRPANENGALQTELINDGGNIVRP